MKKTLVITIIFVVIALLHILAVKLIFSDKKPEKAGAGTDSVAPDVPQIKEPQPKIPTRVPPRKVAPAVARRFGIPLNYKHAIMGNILELPGSKNAKSGILVDVGSRNVLWSKNPKQGAPIASMTKMMTLLLAMEDIRAGKVQLNTRVKVTKAAYLIGGSQVYLDPRETFTLGELMESMAIKSANDSAYLVGEFIGHQDMAGFVARMNQRAKELNMPATHFINPHGLPDNKKNSISSPEGLVLLAERLIEYPQILKWTSTRTAIFRPKTNKHHQLMTNTNKLISSCHGVDGLKTGYTQTAGFCITVTCLRNGKRLIAVVTGFKSSKERNAFVKKLLDWGYKRDAQLSGK